MQYWNGYSWRRVSDVEARFRRVRGQKTMETEPKAKGRGGAALPVKKLDEVLPPATPEPNPIDVLSTLAALKLAETAPESVKLEPITPVTSPFDLSDEELERLTKPES